MTTRTTQEQSIRRPSREQGPNRKTKNEMILLLQHDNALLPSAERLPPAQSDQRAQTLFTFKEAMDYLRISRSTLLWSGQLDGHKVGSTWRFYRADLNGAIRATPARPPTIASDVDQAEGLVAAHS